MKPVLTKKDFVKRYQAGEFGNRSPTWSCLEWLQIPSKSRLGRFYHLRNQVAGGATYYNLNCWRMVEWMNRIRGKERDSWYISEMAPHDCGLIQGEVQRQVGGLYLRYNMARLPMREGFDQTNTWHAWRLTANQVLQRYLCHRSYDWLGYLLEEYKDHVIEFSTFGVDWGTVPGVNTVFWEVRKY